MQVNQPIDTGHDTAEDTPGQGRGKRALLVTIDQAASSGSNVLLLLYVAHALRPIDFGRFTLIFLLAMLGQGLVRSLVSLPLLVHPEDADGRPRALVGNAGLIGLFTAVPCLAGGAILWFIDDPLGPPLVVLAVCLPLLMVQDLGRYLAIGRSTPSRAIVLDVLWIALMVLALGFLHLRDVVDLTSLMLAWAGSGALASAGVLVQYGVPRGRDVSLDWLRERWQFAWRTLVSNLSGNAGAVLAAILMTMVSTALAVAAVRAAILLGRLGAAVQLAVGSSVAADIAREQPDDVGLLRHQRRAMLISGAASVGNIVLLLMLPDRVGEAVLGRMWAVMEPLLLPTGLAVVAMAAQSGVKAALLGRREVRISLRVDLLGTLLSVSSLVLGAAWAGAAGAVWGLVIGQALISGIWWVALLGYLRRRRRTNGVIAEDAAGRPSDNYEE